MSAPSVAECFRYVDLTQEEHIALQKLSEGEASPYEQKLALQVIVNKFARSHDLCFIPEHRDQTSFLNGRAFVGTRILLYLNKPVGKLQEVQNEHT